MVALYSRRLDLRNYYSKAYSVSSCYYITNRSESRLNCTNFRKTKFEHRYDLHSVFVRSLLSYGSLRHRFQCCSCNSIVTPPVSAISLQLSQTCSLRDANIPRPLFSIYTPSLYSREHNRFPVLQSAWFLPHGPPGKGPTALVLAYRRDGSVIYTTCCMVQLGV